MKCPHCLVEFHDQVVEYDLGIDAEGEWIIRKFSCPSPACKKDILYLVNGTWMKNQHGQKIQFSLIKSSLLIRPKVGARSPLPPEVPTLFSEDYLEACIVLPDSPKASAALSRRCLQFLLREKAGVKPGDLAKEIQQVIDSKQLPSYLLDNIDAIRNIGNFAAHPLKSQSTGEIVPVETGEAEWNLDVLEMLFDFYFVQPERSKQKRDALDKKLTDSGKPLMK